MYDKLKNNDLTFQQIYNIVNLSSPLCLILQQGLHTAVCVWAESSALSH